MLSLTPTEALYKLAQEQLDVSGIRVDARWYKPNLPRVLDGTLTSVLFTLDKLSTPVDHWDSPELFTVEYHRLRLNDFKRDEPFRVTLPTDTKVVLTSLFEEYRIRYEDEDFHEVESISSVGSITIYANSDSYRWVGSVDLDLMKYVRTLSDIVERNNIVTDFSDEYSSLGLRDDIVDHLNMINKGRTRRLINKGDVTIGVPIKSGPNRSSRNTRVKLMSIGDEFIGEAYIYYRRKTFDETWGYPLEYVWQSHWVNYTDMLSVIGDTLKCRITQNDIHNELITPPQRNRPVTFTIQFKDDSLGYVGGVTITLKER